MTPSRLKIRFYTSYNPCNFACEYCVTSERNEETREEDRSQKPLPILQRLGKKLAHPEKLLTSARVLATHPSMLSRPKPTVWSEEAYWRIVERMRELPYELDVRIGVGGEFFTNKALVAGARQLSRYDNVSALNLITNLSFSYEQYLRLLDGYDLGKLGLVGSHHPTQIKDPERWLETALRMNELVDLAVILVAWPPVLDDLPALHERFTGEGLTVFVQAFNGWHGGRKYPEAYDERQREMLRSIFYSRHDYAHMVDLKTPGDCYAGVDYVFMNINGDVFRCGGILMPLGNIFEGFELLDGPAACPVSECWCDTDNLNTQAFKDHYAVEGLNQHKYTYRFADRARLDPAWGEWNIDY